jgi:hypothetical protein
VRERIAPADSGRLRLWSERMLSAETLEAIFR